MKDPDENEGSGRSQLRWFVLVLSSLATLGSYYCYDNPSALHDQFKDYFHNTSYAPSFEMYFNLLYTVYSIPNCILPLVGGVLSDMFGIRIMLVVFASFIAFGQFICVIGVMQKSLIVVLIGRIFFGLGGESLSAVASALVSSWFAGKELALAMGIQLSFSRLGSVLNDMLSPWLNDRFSLTVALVFGFGLTIFSLVCGFILICMKGGEEEETQKEEPESPPDFYAAQNPITYSLPLKTTPSRMANTYLSDISDHSDLEMSDMETVSTTPPTNSFRFTSLSVRTSEDSNSSANSGKKQNKSNLTSKYLSTPNVGKRPRRHTAHSPTPAVEDDNQWFKGITKGFWILGFHCMTVYGAIFPFNNISSAVLRDEYGGEKNGVNVGAVQGVPFGIAAILTPIIGVLVDKYGFRVHWMVGSSLLLMTAHAIIFYGPAYGHEDNPYEAFFIDNPVPSFMFIGVGYSVVAGVVWPSSVCVVEPEKTATAFGLLTSFQNTATAVIPLIVATELQDFGEENFRPPEGLFFFISFISLVLALWLWRWDATVGGYVLSDATKGTPVTQKTPKLVRHRLSENSHLLGQANLNTVKTRLELPQYYRGASAEI